MHEQSTNHISLKNRLRCCVKSPTAQDTFDAANTRPHQLRWGNREMEDCYLMHKVQSGGLLALSKRSVEAL